MEQAFKQYFQAHVLRYKCLLSGSYWQFILQMLKILHKHINKWRKLLDKVEDPLIWCTGLAVSYRKTGDIKQDSQQNLTYFESFHVKPLIQKSHFLISKFHLLLIQILPLDMHDCLWKHCRCFKGLRDSWEPNNVMDKDGLGRLFLSTPWQKATCWD